jgi:hypothetical protein
MILLGFVLPSMTVSCTGMPGIGQSFSLYDIASLAGQTILYLVPIGAVVVIVFSLLPTQSISQINQYTIGQLVGAVISGLSILTSIISMNSQMNRLVVFDISPEFGLFVLVIGYVLIGIGIGLQWKDRSQLRDSGAGVYYSDSQSPYVWSQHVPTISEPASSDISNPRLELVSGNLPYRVVPLTKENLSLGRSADNDIKLDASDVSRHHARLRLAQGFWFIQDQESTTGTLVNGQAVHASRLNPGDKITIGDTTFVFRD